MKVAVLALDGVLAMEVGMPFQILGRLPELGYELTLCGENAGPVLTSGGYAVVASADLAFVATADTVVVPAFLRPERDFPAPVLDALRAAHASGARVVSICAGAFALAAAGLLDGRRATTHWVFTDQLAARYPAVTVDPDVLYVDEGDIVTAAGVAAGIDLCLHLVRVDHGAAVANELSRLMVAAPRRDGGQAQFIERSVPSTADTSLASTRSWALQRLADPLTVAALARHAHLSDRTFARQFVAETGTTPLRWLVAARVDRARELLETRDWGSDRVAAECGLGTAANLRVHFRRAVGVSPSDYRRTFAAS